MVHKRFNYFSFWAIFYPFTSLTAQKIKILKKWKKHLEISSFYTSVPKIMIICCTVPEIWCMTDVIIIYLGLFFVLLPPWQPKKSNFWKNERKTWRYHHLTYVYQKIWSDDVQFLRYGAWQMQLKKTPGDITILHVCTKNYDQMMYGSWDMVCDRCNCYFSFWAIFCPFTPLTTQKIKILKVKKTSGDIIILHIWIKNYEQMMYGSWDMVRDRRTDGQMDGQMEKVAYRGGCATQKYKKKNPAKFTLEGLLFSSAIKNDTEKIFVTTSGLIDGKYNHINRKL